MQKWDNIKWIKSPYTIQMKSFLTSLCWLLQECNDLFSRFEQQILFLEKQAEATNPTMDRHGHDGPSQGLVSKHLENLKLGTKNRLSELHNGVAGWTVTGVTDRHRPFTQNQVSELCDGQQDGPSQARRPVTVWIIPVGVGFLVKF